MGSAQLEPKPHPLRALSAGWEVEPRAAIDFSAPQQLESCFPCLDAGGDAQGKADMGPP